MLTQYETQMLQQSPRTKASVRPLVSRSVGHLEAKELQSAAVFCGEFFSVADERQGSKFHLTPRQMKVLSLLCRGYSNKLICRELDISAGTVKVHIGRILRELGASNRLQAVVAAHRHGLAGESSETDISYGVKSGRRTQGSAQFRGSDNKRRCALRAA
jgi:DNA-binding NarL/FixJ family response regulator